MGVSPNVLAARTRREESLALRNFRIEWFIDEIGNKIKLTAKQRVTLATEFLRNKIIENISKPVKKERRKSKKAGKVRTVVTERSKPGEFPRADTTRLRKSIFGVVKETPSGVFGYIGTPLDYGLILELKLDRSFLRRTFNEEWSRILAILNGPLK